MEMRTSRDPMSDTSQAYEWSQYHDVSAMLAVVDAIPDGMRLAEFPSHFEGAECWCRPRIAFVPGEIVVHHKNLAIGEFDT